MSPANPPRPLEPPPRRPHPKPGPEVRGDIERVLRLLRSQIHERGFTQLRVQDALGWGRTYISQLLRQQKSLRLDQVLQILQVIEIEPADFFYRLFGASARQVAAEGEEAPAGPELGLEDELRRLLRLTLALAQLLEAKGLVQRGELAKALDGHGARTADDPRLEVLLGLADEDVAP